MREIAIEGLDGSGKSTVADMLAQHYRAEGQNVHVVAPYRATTTEHGEIYHLWKSHEGSRQAIHLLKGALIHARERAHDDKADLIIFDRHWMTAFSEIAGHPELVDAWGEDFPQTAYLRVASETARSRAGNDTEAPWMHEDSHARYGARYEELCRSHGAHILGIYRNDADVSLDAIVSSIVWDMGIRR